MRAAMDSDELFVEYQPIVLLNDATCIGAEALVRWRRADTILQPSEFLRAINNTPLSGRLTYWVIDTVAADLGEWLGEHPQVQVSINIPPEILGRGGLQYAAERSGLHARMNQIVLEVTEHGVPDQLGLEALNMMAERGLRVALDDVALNGVNLALLARCNFSVIKLDRQLTSQLAVSAPAPNWLAALSSLLRNTGLKVVAEGVETDYQATALHAAGVQMAQGYLFSRSLSAPELIAYHASAS
ncbi:MAG TPA: EAL domain-containing protein [Steroidobacteraceae bacterium]|nr:EAL domain-containing protein [Steroidobacteraceae bacterium]